MAMILPLSYFQFNDVVFHERRTIRVCSHVPITGMRFPVSSAPARHDNSRPCLEVVALICGSGSPAVHVRCVLPPTLACEQSLCFYTGLSKHLLLLFERIGNG